MWDPKDDSVQVNGTKFKRTEKPPPQAIGKIELLHKDDALKHYIRNSGVVAAAYGLKKEGGRLVVGDLEKIKSFDEYTKSILREILTEK